MTYRDRTITKPTRRLWLHMTLGLITIALFLPMVGPTFAAALTVTPSPTVLPTLIINQLQTSGCNSTPPCVEDTKKEFVEVYNTSNVPLQVSGWKIRYISSSGATPTELATMSGQIAAHGYILIAHAGYYPAADLFFGTATSAGVLAKTGGHVEIQDSSATSVDKVGWGTAAQAQTKPVAASMPGQSAERGTDSTGLPLYTNNNFADFVVQPAPNPQSGGLALVSEPVIIPAPSPETAPMPDPAPAVPPVTAPTDPQPSCEGVIISELLPNPAGGDGGHEYIELHNPTNGVIGLGSCSLQTSASTTKKHNFGQTSLQPGEYRSFRDSETTIVLPNSTGGTVWLLGSINELQAIAYPADMEDDTAWALVGDEWAATYTATPGSANIATTLKPCETAGQVRNPDTSRCANIAAADVAAMPNPAQANTATTSSAAGCKMGQERNPATNRCRNIANTLAASTASPCKPGQERNPDTNRCKNTTVPAATAKACPAGQERSTDTNRCRKITAAGSSNGSSLDTVKDAANGTSPSQQKPYFLVAVAAVAAALAYGLYEWRQEIRTQFARRLGKTQPMPAAQA